MQSVESGQPGVYIWEKKRMFGIGSTELIIIFLIVLVIFGAKKLPEIGSGLVGKGITNFKKP